MQLSPEPNEIDSNELQSSPKNGSRSSSPEVLQISEEEQDLDLRFTKPPEEVILNATVRIPPEPQYSELYTTGSDDIEPKIEKKHTTMCTEETTEKPCPKIEGFDVVSPGTIEVREQTKKNVIIGVVILAVVVGGIFAIKKIRN